MNTGDVYSPVILYDHVRDEYSLTTIGDFKAYASEHAPDYGCKLVLTPTGAGTYEDDNGTEYIDFKVDHFTEQMVGTCAIYGIDIEHSVLCLDDGFEYCLHCIHIQHSEEA